MSYASGLTRAPRQAAAAPARSTSARTPSPAPSGNQAQLRRLQAKLKVGAVNDPLEHEADRVADLVMSGLEVSVAAAPPQISRKCTDCEEEKLQKKPAQSQTRVGEAPAIVHEALRSPGRPLDAATRAHFEPRFGHGFSRVRIHTDQRAADASRDLAAQAFTVGEHIVFGKSEYAPDRTTGQHLLAHELTHVVQQRAQGPALQRRAENCPVAEPKPPTIETMGDFIGLVERVEADAGTKNDPIATARLIARTKYDDRAWDWLLPTTKGKPGVVQIVGDGPRVCRPGGQVTTDDIASLCFKLIVSTPDGPIDPMHIIIGIVADAETLPAGTGATGLSRLADPLPASVSQRAASTWVGDVGKAAADWMVVLPLPGGRGDTKDEYMRDSAPPHDLLADIDGVVMTAKLPLSGAALDKKKSLSDNLRFYSRRGRRMRFHIFCDAERFALEADGVTLTASAKADIGQRVKDFAEWYTKNNPGILAYETAVAGSRQVSKAWVQRAEDWKWFADQFITFVQNGLASERAD
jgi:hypothetical protein